MTDSRHPLTLALLFSGMLTACASTPHTQPSDVVRQAGEVLQQASEQHVDDYAAPELRLARAKYAAAQKALQGPKPQQAKDLAQEAIASVRLASIRATVARATANKRSVQRQIDEMEQMAHPSAYPPAATAGDTQ